MTNTADNKSSLCIVQAASLTPTAPGDYSIPPPAMVEKGLQVHYNEHCIMYTFYGILPIAKLDPV